MTLKLLVTGTGYSGTGWAALLLSSAGMPCGHEAVFKHDGRIVPPLSPAESSWAAAFRLDHPLLEKAEKIHLMRHPLRVIESWASARPDETYRRIGADSDSPSLLGRLAGRYLLFLRLLESIPAVRIEDGPEALLSLADLPLPPSPPAAVNRHRLDDAQNLTWDDISTCAEGMTLRKWAESFDYGDNK